MKKIILILMLAFVASCGAKTPETQTGSTATGETSTGTTQTGSTDTSNLAVENGSFVEVYYSLRDTDENGEIIDSNMDENGNPTKPALPVSIGAGGVIPGFEKALIGMRAGETKSVAVAPEDGYTTQTNTTEGVDYEDLAPVFTITENKSSVLGVTQEEIPLSEVNAQLFEGKNPGDILAEQNGTTVKLISKTDTSAQVEFIATSSPFYGKELTVGMSETFNGVTFTVTKIEGDNVTLDVINTNSPFYKEGENKALEDGAIAEMDENGTKISIKILKVHTAED